eukprot:CAMPEP_0174932286 /NCGR_PEP_ID=MMETSP1355-20121228/35615_1 /TAXON_ID=464990 /ORGANISM="Hemiselmis tepida, Strain CCMP443" /LENGTH=450 /DNA_ID=CAMNT_0016178687 /DNA_START=170 /DNA_END=1518 /DNA_ORIENTATION=-
MSRVTGEEAAAGASGTGRALADGGEWAAEVGKRKKRELGRDKGVAPEDRKVKKPKAEAPAPPAGSRKQAAGEESDDDDGGDGKTPTPKSRFYGVHWNRRKRKWRVRIKANGRDTHVGYFNDEGSAARAYDQAVLTHAAPPGSSAPSRDLSARLNFPRDAASSLAAASAAEAAAGAERRAADREGVGAICMILAASQSPRRHADAPGLGAEMETPPPQPNSAADFGHLGGMSPPDRATGRMLPPVGAVPFNSLSTDRDASCGSTPHTPSPPSLCAGESLSGRVLEPQQEAHGVSPTLSTISSRSTPAHHSKPSAHKPSGGVAMKIPFPVGDASETPLLAPGAKALQEGGGGLARPAGGPWAPSGAFLTPGQLGAAPGGAGEVAPSGRAARGGACSSPSSLCDEGELEALRGLLELVDACESEAQREAAAPPKPPAPKLSSRGVQAAAAAAS